MIPGGFVAALRFLEGWCPALHHGRRYRRRQCHNCRTHAVFVAGAM